MTIKILAFGIARDILGGNEVQLQLPPEATVGQLKEQLCQSYPSFEKLASLSIALNADYVPDERKITPTDEVVIIPPVSGG